MTRHPRRALALVCAGICTGCLPDELAPHWVADAAHLTNQEVSDIDLFLTRLDDGPDGEQLYTAKLDYVDTDDAAWGQLSWCRLVCEEDQPSSVLVFLDGSTDAVLQAGEGDPVYGTPDLEGDVRGEALTLSWRTHTNLYRHLVPFEATFEPAPP